MWITKLRVFNDAISSAGYRASSKIEILRGLEGGGYDLFEGIILEFAGKTRKSLNSQRVETEISITERTEHYRYTGLLRMRSRQCYITSPSFTSGISCFRLLHILSKLRVTWGARPCVKPTAYSISEATQQISMKSVMGESTTGPN